MMGNGKLKGRAAGSATIDAERTSHDNHNESHNDGTAVVHHFKYTATRTIEGHETTDRSTTHEQQDNNGKGSSKKRGCFAGCLAMLKKK